MHPRDLLMTLNASALKSLSQNFLTSPHWAEKLSNSILDGDIPDEYWEIGPGLGALTKPLIEKANASVRLFEIDRKISEYLQEQFPKTPLEHGDFLETDFSNYSGKKIAILSNLPYQISSQILFQCLELKTQVLRMVFTFQKEFADRLEAKKGTKEYGALSILIQLNYKMESLGILPAGAFYPPPTIASKALKFTPKNEILPADLSLIVKTAFKQRRKKMLSNLEKDLPGTNWKSAFESLQFSTDIRAETLSPEEFLKLAQHSRLKNNLIT